MSPFVIWYCTNCGERLMNIDNITAHRDKTGHNFYNAKWQRFKNGEWKDVENSGDPTQTKEKTK